MREHICQENRFAQEQSLWRSPAQMEDCKSTEVVIAGGKYINFSSNDYLGYSRDERVISRAREALERYGSGGRASRLISGTLELHKELEERLAAFKQTESALVYPTGFMANLGVISSLLSEGDAIILDRLNHASLIDAARLSRCRMFVYEHRSISSLEKVLFRTRAYKKRLVATDSLFSMDGDLAPLREMVQLCKKNRVWLMIDDAHATGVLGEKGIGLAEQCGVLGEVEIVMGTLSKALASQGGFVCGSKDFVSYLINRSRPFIYTTALSPVSTAAAMAALELVQEEPWRRGKLLRISKTLRDKLKEKFPSQAKVLSDPPTPILPLVAGTIGKVLRLSHHLRESGIFVPAIRPPTVGKNECRLRISLSSEHTEEQIENLLASLPMHLSWEASKK